MKPVAHLRLVPNGYVSVKELAARYGLSKNSLYELIKSDPTFPYKNLGLKKKFMIDVEQFEKWLAERTEKQKREHFVIPSAIDLMTAFKSGGDN